EDLAVALVEAALGQASMQRHLAALEPAEANAGASGLALAAAPAHLAHAGADAAADAQARFARSGIVFQLVEAHLGLPLPPLWRSHALSSTTRTRWRILWIM